MDEMATDQAADIAEIAAQLPVEEEEDSDELPEPLTPAQKKAEIQRVRNEKKADIEKKREEKAAQRQLKRDENRKAKGVTLPSQRVSLVFRNDYVIHIMSRQSSSRRAVVNNDGAVEPGVGNVTVSLFLPWRTTSHLYRRCRTARCKCLQSARVGEQRAATSARVRRALLDA